MGCRASHAATSGPQPFVRPLSHRDDGTKASEASPDSRPSVSTTVESGSDWSSETLETPVGHTLSANSALRKQLSEDIHEVVIRDERKHKINLLVSKDRGTVQADVGHSDLSRFLSGSVCSVVSEVEALTHSWTVALGPFAKHTIRVGKNSTGELIALSVDGEVFVEADAKGGSFEDNAVLRRRGWQCDFSFVGERILDFEVFKSHEDGTVLDETEHLEETRTYTHQCSVAIPNDLDFSTARFLIDGIDFRELQSIPDRRLEPNISTCCGTMARTYGITVPEKPEQPSPSSMAFLANAILATAETSKFAASDFFAGLLCGPTSGSSYELVEVVATGVEGAHDNQSEGHARSSPRVLCSI